MAVNMNAEKIGEVKDIAYDTSGKMALIISSPQGVEKFYSMDETVAIKDVVLVDENRAVSGESRIPSTGIPGVSQEPRKSIPITEVLPARQPNTVPAGGIWGNTGPTVMMKTCPWCKKENRAQSKFCVHCGRQL